MIAARNETKLQTLFRMCRTIDICTYHYDWMSVAPFWLAANELSLVFFFQLAPRRLQVLGGAVAGRIHVGFRQTGGSLGYATPYRYKLAFIPFRRDHEDTQEGARYVFSNLQFEEAIPARGLSCCRVPLLTVVCSVKFWPTNPASRPDRCRS